MKLDTEPRTIRLEYLSNLEQFAIGLVEVSPVGPEWRLDLIKQVHAEKIARETAVGFSAHEFDA